MNNKSKGVYVLSAICFSTSMYLPTYSTGNGGADGLALLLTGWLYFFVDPLASLSWFANPLYILSLCYGLKGKQPEYLLVLSFMSFLLTLSLLGVKSTVTDAGGMSRSIIEYNAGYWLWILAPFLLMIAQSMGIKTTSTEE